jgi:subtilisin family serine protease
MLLFALFLVETGAALAENTRSSNSITVPANSAQNFIDPSLLEAAIEHKSTGQDPVIIMFSSASFKEDSQAFLQRYQGHGFELEYTFQIIPAISGILDELNFTGISSLGYSVQVYNNTVYQLSLPNLNQTASAASSDEIQNSATNWWDQAIGLVRNGAASPEVAGLNGSSIKVGIIDTGIGYKSSTGGIDYHVDLAGKVASSVNFASGMASTDVYDEFGHGTHVAGIIAGSGLASNGEYAGIAPGVQLYDIKVLNDSGSGFEGDIIAGIAYAVTNHLNIISLSLGGGLADPTDPESQALLNATRQGVLAVVAAGNSGPSYFTASSPGGAPGIITVGSVGPSLTVSDFSSRGPNLGRLFEPSVVAPGEGIISTLGYNSYLERLLNYFGEVIVTNKTLGEENGYIPLDGTSMATPMVTGCAALILQKFKSYSLSPETVIASLMETATPIGSSPSPCDEGMGLVNVSAAVDFISSMVNSSTHSINPFAKIFPKQLLYAPYDTVLFPGDSQDVLMEILYNGSRTFTFSRNMTVLPAGLQISFAQNPAISIGSGGIIFVNVSISCNFTMDPGKYNILYSLEAGSVTLDTFTVSLELRDPALNVLIDTFHPMSDALNINSPANNVASAYYSTIQNLSASGIRVSCSMDYWSPGYNSSTQTDFFDDATLSMYDVVVLPGSVIGYFPSEIAALRQFNENGGDLIIMGELSQDFSIAATNSLLAALGTGASFTDSNYLNYSDYGWDYNYSPISVTNIAQGNPLLSHVSSIAWDGGCTYQGSNASVVPLVAMNDGSGNLMGFLNSTGRRGSIFISGEDFLSAGNPQLVSNIFAYFTRTRPIHVNSQVSPVHIYTQARASIYFEIANTATGEHYTSSSASVNCTLYNGTTPVQTIGLAQSDGNWFGNGSVPVAAISPSSSPYLLEVNYSIGVDSYTANFYICKYLPASPAVDSTILTQDVFRDQTLSIHFNATVGNLTFTISGFRDSIFSQTPAFQYTGTIYGGASFSLPLQFEMPSGYYVVTFQNNAVNQNPFAMNRSVFFVDDYGPTINESASSFQGTKFTSIDLGGGSVAVQQAQTNTPLSVVVSGSDPEMALSNMTAFAIFYPTYIIGSSVGLITYENPFISQLNYSASSGAFSGKITIPNGATFLVNGQEVKKTFTSSGNYSGAIVVVLRDSDGNYDYFIVLLQITTPPPTLLIIGIVVIAAAALASLLIAITLIRRRTGGRRPRPRPFEGTYQAPVGLPASMNERVRDTGLKFCPFCGKPLSFPSRFCPKCGKQIYFGA